MNVLCKGYIKYARYILKDSDELEYIPALHSSQSSIENHFSCVRDIGKDRTDLYGTAVMQLNFRANMKGNSSYTSNEIDLNVEKCNILNMKQTVLHNKECVKSMLNKYTYPNDGLVFTNLLPMKIIPSATIAGFKMNKYFYEALLKEKLSYQGLLRNDHMCYIYV